MRCHRDQNGRIILHVPVDDETIAWLVEIADMHHVPPEMIAAAVLRDIREDDQDAHLEAQMRPPTNGGTNALN